jgi:hypothetical protein
MAADLGLHDAHLASGKSFRIGAATALAMRGASEAIVKAIGGWSSEAYCTGAAFTRWLPSVQAGSTLSLAAARFACDGGLGVFRPSSLLTGDETSCTLSLADYNLT